MYQTQRKRIRRPPPEFSSIPTQISKIGKSSSSVISINLQEVRWNLTDPYLTSTLNDVHPISPRRLQNLVSKALPTQLGQLSYVWRVYLDSNQLESTVPTQLALVRVLV